MPPFVVRAGRPAGLAKPLIRAAAVLAAAGVVTLAAGCGPASNGTPGSAAPPSTSEDQIGAPSAAPSVQMGGYGTGTSGRPIPATSSSSPRSSGPTGPIVAYFRVKQQPQCPKGTNVAPIAGVPLIIEWQVNGVDEVTLAVDGAGKYKTYDGSKGSETFDFSCGGAPGTVNTHKYTITAEQDGQDVAKSLSASATTNEIPNV
jgi:hypothetical protein